MPGILEASTPIRSCTGITVPGIIRWKADRMVVFERCQNSRKRHLLFSAWAWQASRLPSPASKGSWTIQPLSGPGRKNKAFLIAQKDYFVKCPASWERRKKTQSNFRDL